jgi:hypothetical protein
LKIKIEDLDGLGHKNEKRWRFLRDFQGSLLGHEHKINNLSSLASASEVSVEAGFDIAEDNYLTAFEVDRICARAALDLWAQATFNKGIDALTQTSIHEETQKRSNLISGILFDLCIWNLVSQLSGGSYWDEFKSNPWVKKSLDIATLQIDTIPTLTPERGREELDTYVWTMARAQAIFLKHICTERLPLAKNEDSGYDLN